MYGGKPWTPEGRVEGKGFHTWPGHTILYSGNITALQWGCCDEERRPKMFGQSQTRMEHPEPLGQKRFGSLWAWLFQAHCLRIRVMAPGSLRRTPTPPNKEGGALWKPIPCRKTSLIKSLSFILMKEADRTKGGKAEAWLDCTCTKCTIRNRVTVQTTVNSSDLYHFWLKAL